MAKANNLVIVESPAKAKTIEKYLGSGYKVTASMGHLRDLPKSKMGVDIENGFEPQYIAVRDKKDVINELKKEAKIEKLEEENDKLKEKLLIPEIASSYMKLSEVQEEIDANDEKLMELMEEWEKLNEG